MKKTTTFASIYYVVTNVKTDVLTVNINYNYEKGKRNDCCHVLACHG